MPTLGTLLLIKFTDNKKQATAKNMRIAQQSRDVFLTFTFVQSLQEFLSTIYKDASFSDKIEIHTISQYK